jgi:hypothetical protein
VAQIFDGVLFRGRFAVASNRVRQGHSSRFVAVGF